MRTTALLLAILGGFIVSIPAETLQEQLGFDPNDRLLIIHADDVGMCHAANQATIHAMEEGVVTSGSIMMPCPWVPEIAAYYRDHPETDLGVHFTLNAEWKGYRWPGLAPRDAIGGLLDPMGYLWGDVRETVMNATPQEVERELRAQVEHALKMGLRPTHLDSHMGTVFAKREYLESALAIAEEFGIPFMLPEPTPEVIRQWGEREFLSEEFVQRARARGLPMLSGLYMSYEFNSEKDSRQAYRKIIQNLPAGVSQLIVHLGRESEELKATSSTWRIRTTDYAIMTDPATRKMIDDAGVKLIGWGAIQEAWRKKR